jgi:hypothetical protein
LISVNLTLKIKCAHFVGRVDAECDEYTEESLDALKIDYKLENRELYLKTNNDWEKPIAYIPDFDPTESYWSKTKDADFQDVFLFLVNSTVSERKRNIKIQQ